MEFILRCNDLKCRAQLHDRAVVTTCSHVFCPQCSESSGLSRASNGGRQCPACGSALVNPDDVVVAGLNPSEDYKTSVLSGLSPSIIMECASRGLAFYSYQSSQEIIYQEHLAKNLTEKYGTLNQQVDQLIHEANAQIGALREKMQAMQAEQASLEEKNHELSNAFREKSQAHQQMQKLYNSLKAQVMASHVANAAGDEADSALHTVRADRYVDRLPGTRTGASSFGYQRGGQGRMPNRAGSGSSGSGGCLPGSLPLGGPWNSQNQRSGLAGNSIAMGTPSQRQSQSRVPVLGGTRAKAYMAADMAPSFQGTPSSTRQPLGVMSGNSISGLRYQGKPSRRPAATGPLAR